MYGRDGKRDEAHTYWTMEEKDPGGDVFKGNGEERVSSPSSAPILPSSFRFDCPINYSPELDPGAFGGNKQAANFDTTGRGGERGTKLNQL